MRFAPSQISRYVTARTLTGVGGALIVFSAVIILSNFVELSRSVNPAWGEVPASTLFGLALLESPGVILIIMPFVFLFGVLSTFMNLNRRSELIALRAAGVSAWRFVTPAAAAAALIGVLTMTALNPIASEMSATFDRLKAQLLDGPAGADKTIWLRQGDRHRQIIIRARSNQGPGVHLKGVSLFVNRVLPDGRLQFSERFEASDATLKRKTWTLTGVRAFGPGSLGISSPSLELPSDLSEHAALQRFSAANAVPFWSLPELIVRTEAAGISATAYRLQLQQLLATPLMYAAMSVLAAAFSLRLLRLGGMAQFAGSGVALGFVFFFFNQLCSSLGKSDVLPPSIAAWAPPVMALLVGITLLCYTEDG
jgi:lipopolysaccharide export system permease protein